MTALVLSLALAQFQLDVFENTAAFTEMDTKDGITLSKRPIKDSPFFEYRATSVSSYSVAQLCDATFEWGSHEGDSPGISLFKVLEDGERQRVVYNQLTKPVVARRDYSLTIVQEPLDATHCRIRFRTTNDKAPKAPDGFVRMEKLWGEWSFVASEQGTRISYILYSDPAGSVPAFLVHGGQSSATREALTIALAKTKKWVEAKK